MPLPNDTAVIDQEETQYENVDGMSPQYGQSQEWINPDDSGSFGSGVDNLDDVQQPDVPTASRSEFLTIAKRAYEQSESFMEISQTKRWRKNFALAQSEHPDGSRYLTEQYANRARHFRGKTEAALRKNEAALAVAMFSNKDVVSITPSTDAIKGADEMVKSLHKVVNYHLEESIAWFLTSLGGYHESMIAGDVVSKQYWDYSRDEQGNVETDIPAIDLVALENLKISPSANWRDPIHSSPFVILEVPMYIGDIKSRMLVDWIPYNDSEIQTAAAVNNFKLNSLKQARQGRQQATSTETDRSKITDFDLVYVNENYIRHEDEDWFFYTLGKELILSDPVPVTSAYPHLRKRKRPFVWGTVTIEPHKLYRRSMVDRVASAQNLANEIGNLRVDNVRQVLNKRKYVQRYMGVDYNALKASVPGGMVLMDDIKAVQSEETHDVTSSSYQEQSVINNDFDELSGTFSSASVSDNKQLNETVGGMNLLSGNANSLTEYQLRVFVTTWVEPVIKHIVDMVQFYEDDASIQEITGDAKLTNGHLQVPVKVRADVGFGSTDPNAKIQKLILGIKTVIQLPGIVQQMDVVQVAREIFSVLGFNDGRKFLPEKGDGEDPRLTQLQQQVEQLTQLIKGKQLDAKLKAEADIQIEQVRGKNRLNEVSIQADNTRQIALSTLAVNQGLKLKELESKFGLDSGKMNLEYLKQVNERMQVMNNEKELNFKIQTGQQGI